MTTKVDGGIEVMEAIVLFCNRTNDARRAASKVVLGGTGCNLLPYCTQR